MASTFKLESSNNVTTLATIYTVPAATTAIVLGLVVANDAGGTTDITATVQVVNGAVTTKLCDATPVPATSSISPLSWNQRLVLETGNSIGVSASGNADVTLSVMEMT